MKWFKKFFTLSIFRDTQTTENSTEQIASSEIKDIDLYVDEYLARFNVNVDYSGDQRDHQLLDKIRRDAADQEDDIVLSALLNGLEKTAKFGILSFEGKSFLKAIGQLGDRKAVGPLRLLFDSFVDPKKRADRDLVTLTLFSLGDLNWIKERVSLQDLVMMLVVSKINTDGSIRFTHHLSGATIVEAGELLQRDGDFHALLELTMAHNSYAEQEVVVKAISTT
ncbi:MAG: hypothetical protein ACRBF0_18885 [Calditrichia bacterium]